MAYAENIAACDALKLLAERGVDDPHGQLLSALRDGSVTAGGYVRQYSPPKQAGKAPWREIPWVWWRHGNSKIDDGVAYFDNAATEPPTPFRVEGIEISKASIDALWPPAAVNSHGRPFENVESPRGNATARSDIARRRGPRPVKLERAAQKMTEEMALGALSRQDLAGMKEEAMKARYGVSRDTARKARAKALATLPVLGLETSTNSDK